MAHATSSEEFFIRFTGSVVLLKGIKKYASKSVLSCRVCPPLPHSEEFKKKRGQSIQQLTVQKNQSNC